MTKNTKECIQYGTAVLSLSSGVVLSFLSFFLNKYDISDGVLWYVSQTLMYAGSIFGVSLYIHSKFGEIRNYITEKENEYTGANKLAKKPCKACSDGSSIDTVADDNCVQCESVSKE